MHTHYIETPLACLSDVSNRDLYFYVHYRHTMCIDFVFPHNVYVRFDVCVEKPTTNRNLPEPTTQQNNNHSWKYRRLDAMQPRPSMQWSRRFECETNQPTGLRWTRCEWHPQNAIPWTLIAIESLQNYGTTKRKKIAYYIDIKIQLPQYYMSISQ